MLITLCIKTLLKTQLKVLAILQTPIVNQFIDGKIISLRHV